VSAPFDLDELLARDQFVRVEQAAPGDVVVYRNASAEIDHTGLVSRVEQVGQRPVTFVWSKWGALEECEHSEKGCPYADCSVEYWRLKDV